MAAPLKSLLPQRRNTFIVIVILFVLGTAFATYYFYYIPGNRQRLHQYGFRVLSGISANMKARNSDLLKLYTNLVNGEFRDARTREDTAAMKKALDALPEQVKASFSRNTDTTRAGTYIKGNLLEYHITPKKQAAIKLVLPVEKLIQPIIGYRNELFTSYLLLKLDHGPGTMVYYDERLGLDNQVQPDSLLMHYRGTTFSQIIDISIQGISYKLFCFPFMMGQERLVLGGLIRNTDYRQRLGSIPVYLVYPLIIVLLLIIISLPFLKIYLMGPYEQVKFSDLANLALAIFGGVTVITMIVIQMLLLARGYMMANTGLRTLSGQIEQSLTGEVQQIRQQMRFLDAAFLRVLQGDSIQTTHTLAVQVRSKKSRYAIPLTPPSGQPYYNFERINWVSRTGMQRFRVQLPDTSNLYLISVKERDYYRFFAQQPGNGTDTGISLLDPVYSWSGGDFVINLVESSRIDSMALVAFSARMYSLLNTVIPPGYGFCIIDSKGKVYIHSEADRNLKENFFDEAADAGPLRDAISSRQDTTLNNVHCYGKTHSLYIHPLSQRLVMHPVAGRSFYLLTFYNNGYITPVNLRILLFSLVCTFFTFLLVCCWLLLHHGFSKRSLLYRDPLAARFTWIIPREADDAIYRKGLWFLVLYLVVLLTCGVFGKWFDDYVTFALGLISPLNILILLYAYHSCSQPGHRSHSWKIAAYLLLMLGYSVFVYWLLAIGQSGGGGAFWLFQGVLLLILVVMWGWPQANEATAAAPPLPVSLMHYSWFVLLLALCLGVMPMAVFTWYAHNREIVQSVKRQQLCMAHCLEKRRPALLGLVKNFRNTGAPVKGYYTHWCWQRGIYSTGRDHIMPVKPWDQPPGNTWNVPELYYSRLAGQINMNNEEDPSSLSLLQQAADGAWYWDQQKGGLALHYRLAPGNYPDRVQAIQIITRPPVRYLFLSGWQHITMLLLAVLLLLAGILFLIRSAVSRIFLLDFVRIFRDAEPDKTLEKNTLPFTDEETKAMIQQQYQRGVYFKSKWNRLTGSQKVILLDLAADGLVNYKNAMEISTLLGAEGALGIYNGLIVIRDPVFRQFLLEQRHTAESAELRKQYNARSLWESIRTPLLVIVALVGLFIFTTQEDISKKLLVLLTTLSTLLPLLPKVLSSFRPAPPVKSGEGGM